MKCPKCNKEGAKYLHRKSEIYSTGRTKKSRMAITDNIGFCKHCKYKGEI